MLAEAEERGARSGEHAGPWGRGPGPASRPSAGMQPRGPACRPLPRAAPGALKQIYRNSRFNLRWAPGPGAAESKGSACPAAAGSAPVKCQHLFPIKELLFLQSCRATAFET